MLSFTLTCTFLLFLKALPFAGALTSSKPPKVVSSSRALPHP
jgi:hypothetical protein